MPFWGAHILAGNDGHKLLYNVISDQWYEQSTLISNLGLTDTCRGRAVLLIATDLYGAWYRMSTQYSNNNNKST